MTFASLIQCHFELHCPPLHWSSITENISFKAEFTLSSSSVKVVFTDITISILEKSHSLLALFLRGFVDHAMAARPHGYYCVICPFSSGGNIIQKKKKPDAFYDPCPRPMAWARVTINERHVISVKVERKERRIGLSFRGLFFSFLLNILTCIRTPWRFFSELTIAA